MPPEFFGIAGGVFSAEFRVRGCDGAPHTLRRIITASAAKVKGRSDDCLLVALLPSLGKSSSGAVLSVLDLRLPGNPFILSG